MKLQVDVYHLQMLEGNLTHRIKELLPYIGTFSYEISRTDLVDTEFCSIEAIESFRNGNVSQ